MPLLARYLFLESSCITRTLAHLSQSTVILVRTAASASGCTSCSDKFESQIEAEMFRRHPGSQKDKPADRRHKITQTSVHTYVGTFFMWFGFSWTRKQIFRSLQTEPLENCYHSEAFQQTLLDSFLRVCRKLFLLDFIYGCDFTSSATVNNGRQN